MTSKNEKSDEQSLPNMDKKMPDLHKIVNEDKTNHTEKINKETEK